MQTIHENMARLPFAQKCFKGQINSFGRLDLNRRLCLTIMSLRAMRLVIHALTIALTT